MRNSAAWRNGSRPTWARMCRCTSRSSIPEYLLKNLPITPVPTLERAKAIADAEGLHYVYIGNVPGHPAQNTYCPQCRQMLVERVGFTASQMLIQKDSLPILPASHPRHLARVRAPRRFDA